MDKDYLGYPLDIQRIPFQRHLKLRVQVNGTIAITVGKLISQKQIFKFLEQHKLWIDKSQKDHAELRKKYPIKKYINGEFFPYIGEEKPLKIELRKTKNLKFIFTSDFLLCHQPIDENFHSRDFKESLIKCYKSAGKKWLINRVNHWSMQMQLHPKKLSFRSQKTRWGSCSSSGNISLNWRLLAAPLPVMDYVVIHELAHLKHQNHSSQFWALVATFDPLYKYHRRWLRENQWAFDFLARRSELHIEKDLVFS